jgi:succinate-semialdehyde dehydrogenase/glutarate-semialdehyde dehydrogenase
MSRRLRSGVTLFELMVVLMLLAITTAAVVPAFLGGHFATAERRTATAIADALETGMVGVNSIAISTPETPFGGVKDSGYGHEGGIEGLDAYLNRKFISQA